MTPSVAQPSASSLPPPPTSTAEGPKGGFPLSGPSALPDPATHAYRQDLADVALAGRVIASHYAEPLDRRLSRAAPLLAGPSADAAVVAQLPEGATLRMLDRSRGWAWGYAEGRVGYVAAGAL